MSAVIVDIEHDGLAPRTWIWPFEKLGGEYQFGGRTGTGYLQPGTPQVFGPPETEGAYTGPFGELIETISVAPADLARMRASITGGKA